MAQNNKPMSFWKNAWIIRLILIIGIFTLSNFQGITTFAARLDPSFNPEILREATINSIAVQLNGKIIVAGDLLKVGATERNYVTRFNSDGSLDESFNPGTLVSRSVSDIAIQPDGKIILVGRFLPFNSRGTTRIIRLNEDGSFDETFNSGTGANGTVFSVQISNQSNGKILIAGGFTQYNGVARNRIARLNSDGSLDTTFNPNAGANSTIQEIRVQTDGKIIIVGSFTTYDGTTRNRIARINSNGTLDTSFNPGTGFNSGVVFSLELQPNGNILAGGNFSAFNGATRNGIAQISSTGTLTNGFAGAGANGSILEIAINDDGSQIYLGGIFTTYNQLSRNGIVRVDANGVVESNLNFGTGINQTNSSILKFRVLAIKVVNAGNEILFGGVFQSYNGNTRISLARISSSGLISSTFNSPIYTNGSVQSVYPQNGGKVLVAGDFFLVNGMIRNKIVRLNADGSLDNSFNPGSGTDSVYFFVHNIQPDGRIFIDGSFISFNGIARNRVARLNTDGSVDLSFNPGTGPNDLLNDVAIQNDGKLVVVGYFTSYNGTNKSRIAQLNSDGSLDTSFNPSTDNSIVEAKFDNNGGILLAGFFATCNGVARNRIARINAVTGVLDTNFNPGSGANSSIYSIGTDRNGIVNNNNLTIGGEFTQFNGVNASRLTKLQANGSIDLIFNTNAGSGLNFAPYVTRIQSDGKILVVGTFSNYAGFERGRIVRINQNGTIDTTFNPTSGASDFVNSLALNSTEDEIFVVGDFSRFSCSRRTGIAKIISGADSNCLESNANSRPQFDFDGDGKSDISVFRQSDRNWYLNRSSQGFAAVQWGIATDKIAPADYDGDGKTDVAVWREGSFADFYVLNSADNTVRVEQFGQTGDVLTVGDWDGDGKADPAVYRDSAVGAQSYFYYRGSLNNPNRNVTYLQWGATGDKPQLGDFDNDGKTDLAVFRGSNNTWYIRQSSDSQIRYENWGLATDKFVPADYDGDGKTDLAVFRNGTWYIRNSSNNQPQYINFGIGLDIPVPADFDGDGKADVAVFRNGTWYLLQSASGISIQQFGLANDKPVPAAFIP